MKLIKINVLLLLCFFQISGYTQSEKTMKNDSLILHLKIGKNPSIQFQTLNITPSNLFIQSKPIKKHVPHIQLTLEILEKNKKHTTYLWHFDEASENKKTNYPKAFNEYLFNLKINKEEVALMVNKIDFGKVFFIDIKQTAIIGNLTILFQESVGEWSEDIDGNQVAAFNTYTILLSEKEEQQTFSFTSLKNERSITWKNYQFLLLDNSEKSLKLLVLKKD